MSGRMRTIYGFVLIAALCIAPTGAFAQTPTSREYPYLYKSTRAMGMGGAYTAIGGRVDSLFYNPATLINIPKDKGWEVNLINVSAEVGKNSVDFLNDASDALDTTDLNKDGSTDDDQLRAMNDVLAKYRGENLHVRVADFASIGKSYDRFAFGLGGIANGRMDASTHQGFGPEGLLEVNADATYGGIGGFSAGLSDTFFVGLTLKSLHREALIHKFTARELVEQENDLSNYIKDQLRTTGDAVGFDAGLLWKMAPDSALRPSLGVSVLNIGDLDFKDAGTIPQTLNIGVSINPETFFRSVTLGLDYIDVTKAYTQDSDMAKRIRYGMEIQLFDILPVEMALRAGMYEGSPTFGADLRLLFFTLSGAMYTEEVGAYAGQDKDKRYIATLNFGW